MITLSLIGIGSGNPRHLTLEAIDVLNTADVVLIPQKGPDKDDLAELRRQICDQVLTNPATKVRGFDLPVRDPAIPDYETRVADWHDRIAGIWAREIKAALPGARGRVAFLVWGDPSLYDSTLRIAERVRSHIPLTIDVVPGITSLQALTAGHAIPLNDIAAPVTITTGRMLRQKGWPGDVDTLAVMLDGTCAFTALDPQGIMIWWSAYAGMPQEIRICGPLQQVSDEIVSARAAARARHGWIMDIYLLRRARRADDVP